MHTYIYIYICVCVCASKKLAMRQHRIEQSSLQDVYCSPIHMCVCQQEASQKQAPMLTRSRWHPISTHLCVCRLARRSPSQSPSHHQPHTSLPLAPHPAPPSLSLSPPSTSPHSLPSPHSPPITIFALPSPTSSSTDPLYHGYINYGRRPWATLGSQPPRRAQPWVSHER